VSGWLGGGEVKGQGQTRSIPNRHTPDPTPHTQQAQRRQNERAGHQVSTSERQGCVWAWGGGGWWVRGVWCGVVVVGG
jgi:hypothetical protein